MSDRITLPALAALILATTTGPCFAGITVDAIFRAPEPATMTLFGVAVGGAFLAKKFWARK